MKKILFLAILVWISIGKIHAQETQIMIQAAHSSFISKTILDNDRNLMISYGGYDDKTLKIWDKLTGILLHVYELQDHARGVDINLKEGLAYLGTENNVIVFNYKTFREEKRFNVKSVESLVYNPGDGQVYYFAMVGSDDEMFGAVDLFVLNPSSGQTKKATKLPFPDDTSVMRSEVIVKNQLIRFYTNSMRTMYYVFETGEYGEMKEPPLAVFDNFDLFYIDILDDTRVNAVRYNSVENKVVWEKTIVTEKIDRNNPFSENQISLTPDEKSIWIAPGKSTLIEIDATDGNVKGVIYNKNKKSNIISDNESVYALVIAENEYFQIGNYFKFKRYVKDPVARFGHGIYRPNHLELATNKNQINMLMADGKNKVYSLVSNPGGSQLMDYSNDLKNSYSITGLGFDASKNEFYLSNDSDNKWGVHKYDLGNNQKSISVFNSSTQISEGAELNSFHQKMIVFGPKSFEIMDLKTKTSQGQINFPDVSKFFSMIKTDFSDNGKFLAVPVSDEEVFDEKYEYRLDYYDLIQKKRTWTIPDAHNFVKHISGGMLIGSNLDKSQIEIIDAATGKITQTFKVGKMNHLSTCAVSPDEKLLIVNYDPIDGPKSMEVYNIATGNRISTVNESRMQASFATNSIYYFQSDNSLNFYDVNSNNEVMRLYLFPDNEWIVHTPNGQFDGSQNAWERLVFVNGRNTIPLNQVFDRFYTPRLFYKILNGEKLEEIDIKKLKNAPKVEIFFTENTRNLTVEDDVFATEFQNGKVTVKANGNGSAISEIRLYHNDKIVGSGTRNLVVEDDVQVQNPKEYQVMLVEGENKFTAVAQNSEGTESSAQSIFVDYKPKKQETQKGGIQLHLLVVGIDKYKNPKYNLNYATADAKGFKSNLGGKIQSIVSNKNEYYIENENANREEIIKVFNEIISNAKEQDIFIFYYAGHGVMTEGANGQFFIVPYDVTQLYGADDALAQRGISAEELKALASQVKAQKQLYILDACQSGGALGTVSVRGAAEEKAIAQLARSTGTHWLTASGTEQFATEFDELGHGVFTYVLMDGLSGKADSGDGRITVNEIKAYLESQVPELSGKYKGMPQYPSSFGFGQDFPIGVK